MTSVRPETIYLYVVTVPTCSHKRRTFRANLEIFDQDVSVMDGCLMMETLRSSETSVLTRGTQLNTPEDGILHDL
jgi:hypothetical protein